MSRIQERKKQRREYLKLKGIMFSKTVGTGGLILLILSVLLGLTLAASYSRNAMWFYVIFMGAAIALPWLISKLTLGMVKQAEESERIPYVPPFTPDILPAEEVLVRGSDEPLVEQRDILVRPAASKEETSADQLLRSSEPITPDTLTTEEALVRGSEESVQAQREVLVRPATSTENIQTEQLLRSSQGHD